MIETRGRAAFVVLGCAKNQVEAESMSSKLAGLGWEMTADIPNASVLVVHTCGFLQAARQEALDTVAQLRKAAPRSFLVMTGCFAQYLPDNQKPAGVDAMLGTGEFHRLPEVLARKNTQSKNGFSQTAPVKAPAGFHDATLSRPLRRGQLSSYLRISEGCNHRCTFCIIPQLRGNLKSRAPEEIYAEGRDLVSRGVRELVVISQDTTDYGGDLPVKKNVTGLLKPMLGWKDLTWLRLLYAYPSEVGDDLIDMLAQEEKLCGYLDMPLQHVSDRILKAMARDWGRDETMKLLERLRRRVPNLTLRTTLIVGFPGETDRDFQEMLSAVEAGFFDHMGVFPYSLEPRSPSARSEDIVPNEVAQERTQRLWDAQSRVMEKKNKARLGAEIDIMTEVGPDGTPLTRGIHQAPEVDGQVILEKPPAHAGFHRARITGFQGIDLTAELVPAKRKRGAIAS